HGQVEQAAGGSTDTLAVVGIDRSIGEDDHVGPGRVGGTQHRARVTRVPHVGKNGCQPYVPDLFEGNVHEPTDGDDTLWGDGLGQFRHHVQADPVGGNTRCAGGIHQIDVALHGLGRGVELQHHGG